MWGQHGGQIVFLAVSPGLEIIVFVQCNVLQTKLYLQSVLYTKSALVMCFVQSLIFSVL